MDIRKIFAIPGKPGLFELLSQTKVGAVMRSLVDDKRFPVFASDRISSLEDIGLFTTDKDIPLKDVLKLIFQKEDGKTTSFSHKADVKVLRAYLTEILPNWDQERVHNSDIAKLIQWYNILVEHNYIDLEADTSSETPTDPDTAV